MNLPARGRVAVVLQLPTSGPAPNGGDSWTTVGTGAFVLAPPPDVDFVEVTVAGDVLQTRVLVEVAHGVLEAPGPPLAVALFGAGVRQAVLTLASAREEEWAEAATVGAARFSWVVSVDPLAAFGAVPPAPYLLDAAPVSSAGVPLALNTTLTLTLTSEFEVLFQVSRGVARPGQRGVFTVGCPQTSASPSVTVLYANDVGQWCHGNPEALLDLPRQYEYLVPATQCLQQGLVHHTSLQLLVLLSHFYAEVGKVQEALDVVQPAVSNALQVVMDARRYGWGNDSQGTGAGTGAGAGIALGPDGEPLPAPGPLRLVDDCAMESACYALLNWGVSMLQLDHAGFEEWMPLVAGGLGCPWALSACARALEKQGDVPGAVRLYQAHLARVPDPLTLVHMSTLTPPVLMSQQEVRGL
jgi:hypothetical protein